jgi:T6SS, Phospholipase effector Tle1-like, catalytic domain
VGLWNTVAAYGLPVEEWTIGIDRYLWPLELPDRRPWCRIERACHALSLDDERRTFYPVLWDERGLKPGKISQVWFSGVHSNVGGGYPDDSLAGVPLQWIMTEADAAGLKFKVTPRQPDALLVADSTRDKDGRLYDSRQGLASYYRYGPRDVSTLCNDNYHDVHAPAMIHHSVFDRMRSGATAYAPIGLPQNYEVVLQDGSIAPQGTPPSEIPAQAAQRFARQQGAWNFVWWRRLLYFLTVAATIHLVAFPLFYGVDSAREYTTRLRLIPEILRVAVNFCPAL